MHGRVVSLYSGAGGLDLGFLEAGFDCIWANDVDPDAVATYNRNIGSHAVCGSIDDLRNEIPDEDLDLVIGGPPCQGFSVAGHMRPDDPRSQHVDTFLDVVAERKPKAFVMENVAALAVNRRWTGILDRLRETAAANGYETDVWVLNASHYGVPQARMRMFLVGGLAGVPSQPIPITNEVPPTVRDALRALPPYGEPGNDSKCTAIVTPARNPVLRRSPFAGMLFNGKGRALNLDAPAPTLPASMGGNRTPVIDQAQLDGDADECWIVSYHGRLWAGGKARKTIPKRMRRLTVQEAAAIQTFPSEWDFVGRQSSQFRQIGNAVPPQLAFHVAMAMSTIVGAAGNRDYALAA